MDYLKQVSVQLPESIVERLVVDGEAQGRKLSAQIRWVVLRSYDPKKTR